MPTKAKSSSSQTIGHLKRVKIEDPRSSPWPCDICTSKSNEDTIDIMAYGSDETSLKGHVQCIRLIEELRLDEVASPIRVKIRDRKGYLERLNLKCVACPEMHGAKIQCTCGKCIRAFHINCAQETEGVLFELREKDAKDPFKLNCGRHGGNSSAQRHKMRVQAMQAAKLGDPIVVKFPNYGNTDSWILSVDRSKQEVTITTSPWKDVESISENDKYTVKWGWVVINDDLLSLIPRSDVSKNNAVPSSSTGTTIVLPTPPSSRNSESQTEQKQISEASSPQSVIDLVSPSNETLRSESPQLDEARTSILTPPITPVVASQMQEVARGFQLASIPGLLEAVVEHLFNDREWDRRITQLISGPTRLN